MKRCPFCKGAQLNAQSNLTGTWWHIVCQDCGARGPTAESAETAEALWDNRIEVLCECHLPDDAKD
jgi:hypothetical protein